MVLRLTRLGGSRLAHTCQTFSKFLVPQREEKLCFFVCAGHLYARYPVVINAGHDSSRCSQPMDRAESPTGFIPLIRNGDGCHPAEVPVRGEEDRESADLLLILRSTQRYDRRRREPLDRLPLPLLTLIGIRAHWSAPPLLPMVSPPPQYRQCRSQVTVLYG